MYLYSSLPVVIAAIEGESVSCRTAVYHLLTWSCACVCAVWHWTALSRHAVQEHMFSWLTALDVAVSGFCLKVGKLFFRSCRPQGTSLWSLIIADWPQSLIVVFKYIILRVFGSNFYMTMTGAVREHARATQTVWSVVSPPLWASIAEKVLWSR